MIFSTIFRDLKFHSGGSKRGMFLAFLFNTSFQLITSYRLSSSLRKIPVLKIFCFFINYLQKIYFSCEISNKAKIGNNIKFHHPFGIVIGDGVIIGDNVRIWQQVTIGSHGKKNEKLKYPIINDNVRIYAGAKIIGNVNVGKNVIIGANAVVLKDVPDNHTSVGVPSKNIYN